MWWMLAGCVGIPLLLLFFFGNEADFGGNWFLLGLVAVCTGSHIAMMLGGHSSRSSAAAEEKTDTPKEPSAKEKDTRDDCCH